MDVLLQFMNIFLKLGVLDPEIFFNFLPIPEVR